MASPRSSHQQHVQSYEHADNSFAGATTSCEVPSRSICTSEAEDTFTSCQLGLDHPISKLSMPIRLLPHDWLQNILISNGS